MSRRTEPHAIPTLSPVLEFLRALWALNHRLEVASSVMLRTMGVTAQQRMLLRLVQQLQPVTAGVLARALHVHPGTLSASLRRLEDRGMLVRQRASVDARRVTVSLTASGLETACTIEGTVEGAVARLLASVPPEATAQALDVLRALADLMPRREEPGVSSLGA